ncbi:MAG: S41 family peptidase [Planctomycetota bacterium]
MQLRATLTRHASSLLAATLLFALPWGTRAVGQSAPLPNHSPRSPELRTPPLQSPALPTRTGQPALQQPGGFRPPAGSSAVTAAPGRVGEEVRIAPEAADPEVAEVLARGGELEAQQRWADALTVYEEAVRQFPSESRLQRRFEVARLHFGIERRYADGSFLESVRSLENDAATRLYGELLRKIESHYVVTPPWDKIASRGAASVQLAITKSAVRRHNGVRVASPQVADTQRAIRDTLVACRPIRSRADVLRVESDVARVVASRLGLSPVATALEFTAAATCGLDNYSAFLTPDQLRDVYSQIEGNFVGLGVELKADNGALLIVRVIPGSPAERSKIVAGDRIVAVDGQATADLSTDDAAALLTGEEGSYVRVTLVTATSAAVQRVAIVQRAHVDVPSLEASRIIDEQYGVAYVRIPVFQKATSRDLDKALWDLHSKGMRSLILDLRGNPGGLLTASVELADKFVAQGGIVSTRGRSDGEDFDYRAHRAGTWRVPLVVLIDGDSASASEIFAAAIRDNHRGTIIGVRSYGKGSVQGIFPLGYGGAGIRLTTAKFYSPSGQPISKVGVSPDIVVRRATSAADGRVSVGYRGTDQPADAALDRAVEAARHQVAMR